MKANRTSGNNASKVVPLPQNNGALSDQNDRNSSSQIQSSNGVSIEP